MFLADTGFLTDTQQQELHLVIPMPTLLDLQQPPQPQQLQHLQHHPGSNGSLIYLPSPHFSARNPSSQGTKFCSCFKYPPKETYIAVIEVVCIRLLPRDTEELRAETIHVLKKTAPKPNPTSAGKSPGPSRNSKMTIPGWYLQLTKG